MTNEVIFSSDEFYISYNPERSGFGKIIDSFVNAVTEPKDLPETALCVRGAEHKLSGRYFYILYGDHRAQYKALVPSLAACMDYFNVNIHLIGHSSDLPPRTVQ